MIEAADACGAENFAYPSLLAYRASLAQGKPRSEFQAVWDQVLERCPNWPGFHPDRLSAKQGLDAHRASDIVARRLERLVERENAAPSPATETEAKAQLRRFRPPLFPLLV